MTKKLRITDDTYSVVIPDSISGTFHQPATKLLRSRVMAEVCVRFFNMLNVTTGIME